MITRDRFKVSFRVGEHVNGSEVSYTRVCSNASNDGSKGFDGAKQRVSGRVHGYFFVSFVVFLEDEGDGNRICCVKLWTMVRKFVAMLEETKVMKGKCFCSTFFTC